MNPEELLAELSVCGVIIKAMDNKLRIDAPQGVLTAELRQTLAEQKQAILTLLSSPASIAAPTVPEPDQLDSPPRRLYIEAEREEIISEILRLERKHIREGLHYDRVRYLGDNTLNRQKEFLLDYLYFLCDHLENYTAAKADLEERKAIQEYEKDVEQKLKQQSKSKVVQFPKQTERKRFDFLPTA